MKRIITIAAITIVSTSVAVALTGAIGIATAVPSSQGSAAVVKALGQVEKKQANLARELIYIRNEAKTNRTEVGSKLDALELDVTNIGYETGRVLRCVQHLGGGVGTCSP